MSTLCIIIRLNTLFTSSYLNVITCGE